MEKAFKVFLWLIFTVIFGASPLFVRFVSSRTDEKPISFSDTLGNGDLLIVGSVVAADAIGRILGAPHRAITTGKRLTRVVCGTACLLLFMFSCSEYVKVAGYVDAKTKFNMPNVIHDSIAMFFGIVIAAMGVILAVEEC